MLKSSFCSVTPELPLTSCKINESGNWSNFALVMSSLIVLSHQKKKNSFVNRNTVEKTLIGTVCGAPYFW